MSFFDSLFGRRGNHGTPPQSDPAGGTDPLVRARNSNFDEFNSVSNTIDDIIASRSIVNNAINGINNWGVRPFNEVVINGLEAIPVITDKATRIAQYRTIAAYQDCDWCLEEIADDIMHYDEKGNIVSLEVNPKRADLTQTRRSVLEGEFRRLVDFVRLEEDGFQLCKKFLVEGELAWENIINPEHPDLGIIGMKYIPTEYYETLVNAKTGQKLGIFFDAKKLGDDIRQLVSMSYYGAYRVFNTVFGYNFNRLNQDDCIAMLWPQITYISSNEVSPDGLIVFPLIEKAKQAYYQYVLMEQSAVILRVTHAPERLLFNVNTGDLPDKKANEYVRRFANDLKQKKVLLDRPSQDGKSAPQIANVYNPSTMLESWIFGKSNSNDGTSVESVGSNATYDQIDDIKFFLKRLMKAFKIPWSRYEAPDQMNERNDTISYEEYTFSRMIMRYQQRFAKGLKSTLIAHLKLRGIWDKYSLRESDIKVKFTPPVLFDIYEKQKLLEAKVDMYAKLADRDEFSKILAMKNILGMSDVEIAENYKNLAKEKAWMSMAEWTGEQMGSNGPAKNPELPIEIKDLDQENGGSEGEGGEGGEEAGEEGGEEEGGGNANPFAG